MVFQHSNRNPYRDNFIIVATGQDLMHSEHVLYHKLPSRLLGFLHYVSFSQEARSIRSSEKHGLGGDPPSGAHIPGAFLGDDNVSICVLIFASGAGDRSQDLAHTGKQALFY